MRRFLIVRSSQHAAPAHATPACQAAPRAAAACATHVVVRQPDGSLELGVSAAYLATSAGRPGAGSSAAAADVPSGRRVLLRQNARRWRTIGPLEADTAADTTAGSDLASAPLQQPDAAVDSLAAGDVPAEDSDQSQASAGAGAGVDAGAAGGGEFARRRSREANRRHGLDETPARRSVELAASVSQLAQCLAELHRALAAAAAPAPPRLLRAEPDSPAGECAAGAAAEPSSTARDSLRQQGSAPAASGRRHGAAELEQGLARGQVHEAVPLTYSMRHRMVSALVRVQQAVAQCCQRTGSLSGQGDQHVLGQLDRVLQEVYCIVLQDAVLQIERAS